MSLKDRGINGGHLLPVIPINQQLAKAPDIPALAVETKSGDKLDVVLQDQTTPPFDFYFLQAIGSPTTLAVTGAINDTSITVASDAGFTVGNVVGVFTGARYYFGIVLAKPGGNVLNLDTPLDFAYTAGSNVIAATRELDVNGSIGSPEIFVVSGPGGAAGGLEIDIVRLMISMITSSAADLSLFGNLAALTNGIVLRRNDGTVRNIWNAKTNLDLLNLAYDLTIYQSTNPAQGVDGIGCRYTFGGQDKHGTVVRLGVNETLELLIQDDLTGLDQFRIIAAGSVVDPD